MENTTFLLRSIKEPVSFYFIKFISGSKNLMYKCCFVDHLLCHDDELDSRRIAFIIYMSEEWKEDYGGSLDLFDSIGN